MFLNYQKHFFFEPRLLYIHMIKWYKYILIEYAGFRIAWIKFNFSFLKHSTLGLKTIAKPRYLQKSSIAIYEIFSLKQKILKLFFNFNKVIRHEDISGIISNKQLMVYQLSSINTKMLCFLLFSYNHNYVIKWQNGKKLI